LPRQRGGKLHRLGFGDQRVLAVAADTNELLASGTPLRIALQARRAPAARHDRQRRHVITDAQVLDGRADLDHFARVLVTQDQARRHLQEPATARHAEVGSTNAAAPDAHDGVASGRLRVVDLLDDESLAHSLEHRRAHLRPPSRCRD